MARQYDCTDICPEGYNLLANPTALAQAMGFGDNLEKFCATYEMTIADIAAFRAKFKYWNDAIPSGYGTCDCYVLPIDSMTDQENMLLLDIEAEAVCDEHTGGYYVFLLSTEDWGMI